MLISIQGQKKLFNLPDPLLPQQTPITYALAMDLSLGILLSNGPYIGLDDTRGIQLPE